MATQAAQPSRRSKAALVFAICALLSCWNPFAAPFGLLLGVTSAVGAWRVLSKRGGQMALWALTIGALAAAISLAILVASAGALSKSLSGEPVLERRSPAEVERLLDEAQRRTEAERGRATNELERQHPGKPGEGGPEKAPGK